MNVNEARAACRCGIVECVFKFSRICDPPRRAAKTPRRRCEVRTIPTKAQIRQLYFLALDIDK